MTTTAVAVRRFTVVSSRPFDEIVRRLTSSIGRPEPTEFRRALAESRSVGEMEAVVHSAVGPSDLMEFARFDAGEVLRKGTGGRGPEVLRLVVGNPLIMRAMAETAPDAAAYAPVTILIDGRADGVHLSYDLMESLLAPSGSPQATRVARDLDSKIQALLETAAG